MTIVVCKLLLNALLVVVTTTTGIGGSSQSNGGAQNSQRVENAKVESRSVAGSLSSTIGDLEKNATAPLWVGYTEPSVPGERTICCGNFSDSDNGYCSKCELEGEHHGWNHIDRDKEQTGGTVKLEGSAQLTILLRLQDHHVSRIRVASENCALDAGGLTFTWLTDVKPAESVALLAEYVRQDSSEKHGISNEALTAIALHDGREAQAALETFVAPTQPEELRKHASFWLGAARGKEGFAVLQRMAKNDPSTEVRAQVAFAMNVSKEPAALDEMIRMAHEDSSAHVRGQAIFWLAQKAGKRAVGAIDGAIENDPDTEVKKQAVFALSQLPKDEGVPKLIQVAQSNHNAAVRKQAMFWLGQSEDPRALDFFEKVLTK